MSDDFLSLPDNVLWQRALKYYHEHNFFMVHEVLEVLWKRDTDRKGAFYQAFLQVAVSFYHYGNANFIGARQLARLAIARLNDMPHDFHGVDIKGFLTAYESTMLPLLSNAPGLKPLNGSEVPRITHL